MPAAKASWGVLGCAGIATKVCKGMREAGQDIVAVGSRSVEKAEAWAKEHAPGATGYGSYQAVLDDPKVQIVYIPLPTTMKKEWVLKAAAAKKHVLCDKPLAPTFEDAKEMIDACEAAGVQWMDNTMMMHNERLPRVKGVLADEKFGQVRAVVSAFSIPFGNDPEWAKTNVRMSAAAEPLGCLGDLGWYCIRLSLWAFDYQEPEEVSCHFLETTDEGVPVTIHAVMKYSDGRFASFDSSFKATLRQWGEIVGTKRTVSWDDICVTAVRDQCSYSVGEGSIGELMEAFPQVVEKGEVKGVQHVQLAEKMADLCVNGPIDPFWFQVSRSTQKVMLAVYESGKKGGAFVKVA